MYYYGPMMEQDNGWGFLTTIFWLLLLGLVLYAVIKFIHSQNQNSANADPLKIVKARYAKGEITRKQFELLKKELAK